MRLNLKKCNARPANALNPLWLSVTSKPQPKLVALSSIVWPIRLYDGVSFLFPEIYLLPFTISASPFIIGAINFGISSGLCCPSESKVTIISESLAASKPVFSAAPFPLFE